MPWWGWMIIGLLLLGAELFLVEAQFYLVFLGISAVLVGFLVTAMPDLPAWAHWLAFAVVAVTSMFLFRARLYSKLRPTDAPGLKPDLIGDEVRTTVDVPPGDQGRVEISGSTWTVRNVGATTIRAGERARVVAVDGVVLHIEGSAGA
jgi:membrane protein implicated in regulation of membrane protease activity